MTKVAWSTGKPDKRIGSDLMKPGHVQCSAKSKSTQTRCKNPAMDNGKCRLHGGKAVKNVERTVTTEFTKLFFNFIADPEEEDLVEAAKEASILVLINQELSLITLREHRMMKRIQALKDAGDFTTVSIETERGTSASKYKRTNTRKEVQEGTLGQIQAIEESLTRIADKKAKLIDLKHQYEKGEGLKDTSSVEKFLVALNGAARQVWDGMQPTKRDLIKAERDKQLEGEE